MPTNRRNLSWFDRLVEYGKRSKCSGIEPMKDPVNFFEADESIIVNILGGRARVRKWLKKKRARRIGRTRWQICRFILWPDELEKIKKDTHDAWDRALRRPSFFSCMKKVIDAL